MRRSDKKFLLWWSEAMLLLLALLALSGTVIPFIAMVTAGTFSWLALIPVGVSFVGFLLIAAVFCLLYVNEQRILGG